MFNGAKIEESEKAGSRQELNPGHLARAAMQCSATELRQQMPQFSLSSIFALQNLNFS